MARIKDLGGDSVTSWRDVTEESTDPVLAVDTEGTMLCAHGSSARRSSSPLTTPPT